MIDVLEQQIKERVLDSAALYIQIWSYINTIHDPLVRQIIALRYIDGLPWRQVANNTRYYCPITMYFTQSLPCS